LKSPCSNENGVQVVKSTKAQCSPLKFPYIHSELSWR